MNITILSGGSGNDRLVSGLKQLYKNCNIKIVVNAYDSGKSTGICRKVTDTLGVSDIRKNHERLYRISTDYPDRRLIDFYSNRYDIPVGKELEFIIDRLTDWGLEEFIPVAVSFFSNPLASNFEYKDFSIANIIYAQMYKEYGYEYTNSTFSTLLGIDDCVILNSLDNIYLNAITESGNVILDEGDIVEHKNSEDKITKLIYQGESTELNPLAIDAIYSADLLIISTGTFWSSIYPTLEYLDLYKHINKSTAKKIWALNNEFDKDSYGVSSNDFISIVEKLGLNLNDFIILENTDAREELREDNAKYTIAKYAMGNVNGKHIGINFAKAIFKCYYQLFDNYTRLLIDYDDTLWARDSTLIELSRQNLMILNSISKVLDTSIVSGNSFDSIVGKIYSALGSTAEDVNFEIWADANSSCKYKGKIIHELESYRIPKRDIETITEYLSSSFGLQPYSVNDFCIKYKPLNDISRKLLAELINSKYVEEIAKITGKTTIDIVNANNDKRTILDYYPDELILYIGDETDSGNDSTIAHACKKHIQVSSVEETNLILSLLSEEYL